MNRYLKFFSFNLYNIPAALLLCLLMASQSVHAQEGTVNFDAKKREFLIGEQVKLHLEVKAPVTANVVLPAFGDTLTKEIEIIEQSAVDTIFPDNDVTSQILTMDLVVTSFDTGYHVIPPIPVRVSNDTLQTLPLLLTVLTVKVGDQDEIKAIKDPLDVNFSFLEWLLDNWVWLTAILLVFIILAVIYFYFFKKKPVQEDAVPVVPDKSAHELALEKLEAIREKKLWQNGRIKEYHSEISEVLREYIENRYQINAMEQTTDEIFHNIRYLEIADADKNKLRQVLMLSDMVKFAKEKPLSNENELSLSNAIEFIGSTKVKITKKVEEEDKPAKEDKTE